MKTLTALDSIPVPAPQPDAVYTTAVGDREFTFRGLKKLLGAADYSKAGDRNAGLAARSETEREAARTETWILTRAVDLLFFGLIL